LTPADAGKAVTELLKRCPKTSHPIAQDCFKLLGGMLRQSDRWQPNPGQLRFLVTWAFADLEESAGRQNAFHLLRAILSRKLVLPEVYDLMNRVQELMVQSQAAPVRAACSSALLQFMLDYPLGEQEGLALVVPLLCCLTCSCGRGLFYCFRAHQRAPEFFAYDEWMAQVHSVALCMLVHSASCQLAQAQPFFAALPHSCLRTHACRWHMAALQERSACRSTCNSC
jgi:hypothetical protein